MLRPRRPAVLAALLATVTLVSAVALVQPRTRTDANVLYQAGVALDASGEIVQIDAGAEPDFLTGTRVLDPGPGEDRAAAVRLAEQTRQWLASGTIPGEQIHGGKYSDLATTALLDLHTLTMRSGGVIAGPSSAWRYVWPRDASFVAAAYAETGHLTDAVGILDFLQEVQAENGSFHARYLPDGSGVPDDRGLQTDGTGWALWSLDRILRTAASVPGTYTPSELRDRFTPLLQRSVSYLMTQTDTSTSLPLPSADYWERPESRLTLGTAAPVLAGLEAAERIFRRTGNDDGAARLGERTDHLRSAIVAAFGASGYGRYPGRTARDAAVTFTLPPYLADPLPGARQAWQESIEAMRRPAGGLAPGAAWQETSMSWTPETALYAWAAAANGRPEQARHWLDWIASHRTSIGAIPEKVGPDGSPAHVAPLTWSGALVLLTLAELEEAGASTGAGQGHQPVG